MPAWAWVIVVIVVLAVVAGGLWVGRAARRTAALKERFGPEYDRAAEDAGDRKQAERELTAREERREHLTIRPLEADARARYAAEWESVQARFVDSPLAAIAAADQLVNAVMTDRGYPMDDFTQRTADISVDHPQVVDHYRVAHEITLRSDQGDASTEDLRQAMQHYRALFEDLLGGGGGEFNGAASAPTERTTR